MTVLCQALYTHRGQPYRIDIMEHYLGSICWALYRIKKPRPGEKPTLHDILMAEKVPAFTRAECNRFPKHAGLWANDLLKHFLAQQEGAPDDGQPRLL